MIRVLICDDQDIVRKGLNIILAPQQDIEVVGLAANGEEALELASQKMPNIILMDLKMPVLNGVEATSRIVAEHPEIKVLVLTTYDGDDWVFDAIRAGASGYLLKDTEGERLVEAIHATYAGRVILDPQIAGKIIGAFKDFKFPPQPQPQKKIAQSGTSPLYYETLTDRERSILAEMAEGKSNAQIAADLHLAEGTVKNNVSQIIQKLHVNSRTQAILKALKSGLVDL